MRTFLSVGILIVSIGQICGTPNGEAQTVPKDETITVDTLSEKIWQSNNFPKIYPNLTQTLNVHADPQHYLLITVKQFDVDSENGDYLLIKSGPVLDTSSNGKVLFNLVAPKQYVIDSNDAYIFFDGVHNCRNKTGFSLTIKAIEVADEVIPTATNEPPDTNEVSFYGSYVMGKDGTDFRKNETIANLREAIASMANAYCKLNNLLPQENITSEHIAIKYINECPYLWPNRELCALILFAVEMRIVNNPVCANCYLSKKQVTAMWNEFAKESLNVYDIKLYAEPRSYSSRQFWFIVFGGILLVVTVLTLVMHKCMRFRASSRLNERTAFRAGPSGKSHFMPNYSLDPHPLQQIPSYFESGLVGKPALPTYASAMGFSEEEDGHEDVVFQRNLPQPHNKGA